MVDVMNDLIQKYIKYCEKHEWTPYLTGIILGVLLIPIIPWVNNFIDDMIGVLSVSIIMFIGGFITLIAKIFRL